VITISNTDSIAVFMAGLYGTFFNLATRVHSSLASLMSPLMVVVVVMLFLSALISFF
jgi:hypothetical protein